MIGLLPPQLKSLQYLSVWQSREWWEGFLSWRSYQLLRLKGTGDIDRMGKMSSLLLLQLCEWENGETEVDVEQKWGLLGYKCNGYNCQERKYKLELDQWNLKAAISNLRILLQARSSRIPDWLVFHLNSFFYFLKCVTVWFCLLRLGRWSVFTVI